MTPQKWLRKLDFDREWQFSKSILETKPLTVRGTGAKFWLAMDWEHRWIIYYHQGPENWENSRAVLWAGRGLERAKMILFSLYRTAQKYHHNPTKLWLDRISTQENRFWRSARCPACGAKKYSPCDLDVEKRRLYFAGKRRSSVVGKTHCARKDLVRSRQRETQDVFLTDLGFYKDGRLVEGHKRFEVSLPEFVQCSETGYIHI